MIFLSEKGCWSIFGHVLKFMPGLVWLFSFDLAGVFLVLMNMHVFFSLLLDLKQQLSSVQKEEQFWMHLVEPELFGLVKGFGILSGVHT